MGEFRSKKLSVGYGGAMQLTRQKMQRRNVSFCSCPQEAPLCKHRVRELSWKQAEGDRRGPQPLHRHRHRALALTGEKQFGVALIGVDRVECRSSKSHIQGFPSQASSGPVFSSQCQD